MEAISRAAALSHLEATGELAGLDLSGSNLKGSNLTGANLESANLEGLTAGARGLNQPSESMSQGRQTD
jgi:uncharacterized protein YjbI with pentapeptide repeats